MRNEAIDARGGEAGYIRRAMPSRDLWPSHIIPHPMSDVVRTESPRADLVPAPPIGAAPDAAVLPLPYAAPARQRESTRRLLRLMLVLALPVLAEHVLHMAVGLNDTWLANHVVSITPNMAPAQI